MKKNKILASALLFGSLACFSAVDAADKLMIPLGKSVSIPANGVKKILAVKDNVVDVLNVSDDEIILSGIGTQADATQIILWDRSGKRVYDIETYSEKDVIQEKFYSIINNKNLSLKIFPDCAYLQGQAVSKEEKLRAEKVARVLLDNKPVFSIVEYEGAISSLQQRIESAIKQPDVKVSVISAEIDPNISNQDKPLIATDTANIRIVLEGSVKNQNDYIHLTEVVKGFVNSEDQISNLVSISDPYQVLFQAYILQVTKSDSNDLGITWGGGDGFGDISQGVLNFTELGGADGSAVIPKKVNPFYMKNINRLSLVEAQVKAWEESGKAKIISKPNLMVYASAVAQNKAQSSWGGEKDSKNAASDQGLAYVEVGQTIQVPKDAGNNKTAYEPFDAKLRLCIRDLYVEGDDLKFSVFAQQEEFTTENASAAPANRHSRNIMTTIRIKDQQTVAIGGLISTKRTETVSGVPGLRKLPLVGRLFEERDVDTTENELIILLTPKVTNKNTDLAGNKRFETINVPRRSDKLENLNNIFNQIKSSHVPAVK